MSKLKTRRLDGPEQMVGIGEHKYRVRTQVVIEEVDGKESELGAENHQRIEDTIEVMLSEEDAVSIDKSEQAILATCWPAMRGALAKHLSSVSKKRLKS